MGEGYLAIIIAYIGWVLMSILKFVITPSLMIAAGYHWIEVVVTCSLGATIGVLLFYYAGKAIFIWWKQFRASHFQVKASKKRVVSKRKRQFINFKDKYGLLGLLLVSGLISVPISAVLGAKYFSKRRRTPLYLISAFLVWACLLTFLSWIIKTGIGTCLLLLLSCMIQFWLNYYL